MRFIYSFLFYVATPFILARMAWRGLRERAYLERLNERFAIYPSGNAIKGVIWFHAVSVGESEAAFPLIRAMMRQFPEYPVLVTTTTPTGSARVRAVMDEVAHVYLPWDLPDGVARFLSHFRPVLAVVMETEIWPNLYHACGEQKVPLAIVNARLSERSARGYARLRGLTRQTLAEVELIAAQTSADAGRFLGIGARKDAVKVMGNLKYDLQLPEDYFPQAAALKKSLFGERKVWIAASTHEGEEDQVLRIYDRLRQSHPDLLLVLVPRHPPRFERVASLCSGQRLKVSRRSRNETCEGSEVYLVDTLGELRLFYAASDVAFVGGSLVPVGGHNVLEAALAGVPVLFGPHMFNFDDAGRKLRQAGGAVQVSSSDELASAVRDLLESPDRARSMGERGRVFVESGRGALARVEHALALLVRSARHNGQEPPHQTS